MVIFRERERPEVWLNKVNCELRETFLHCGVFQLYDKNSATDNLRLNKVNCELRDTFLHCGVFQLYDKNSATDNLRLRSYEHQLRWKRAQKQDNTWFNVMQQPFCPTWEFFCIFFFFLYFVCGEIVTPKLHHLSGPCQLHAHASTHTHTHKMTRTAFLSWARLWARCGVLVAVQPHDRQPAAVWSQDLLFKSAKACKIRLSWLMIDGVCYKEIFFFFFLGDFRPFHAVTFSCLVSLQAWKSLQKPAVDSVGGVGGGDLAGFQTVSCHQVLVSGKFDSMKKPVNIVAWKSLLLWCVTKGFWTILCCRVPIPGQLTGVKKACKVLLSWRVAKGFQTVSCWHILIPGQLTGMKKACKDLLSWCVVKGFQTASCWHIVIPGKLTGMKQHCCHGV